MKFEKRAIILHGQLKREEYYSPTFMAASNAHWLPWLQHQLIIRDYEADTPQVPHPYAASYEDWVGEVERFEIDEHTSLIGHSCGGGILLKMLSLNKNMSVDKLVLVAPWIDVEGESLVPGLFDFVLDSSLVARVARGIDIFVSPSDYPVILESVSKIVSEVKGVHVREFDPSYKHFEYRTMRTVEFPELLEAVIK